MTIIGEVAEDGQPPTDVDRLIVIESLRTQIARLQNDIETVGRSLAAEAQRREWCNDYDVWIEDLNQQLSEPWLSASLASRTINVRVSFDITGTRYAMRDAAVTIRDLVAAEVNNGVVPQLTTMFHDVVSSVSGGIN